MSQIRLYFDEDAMDSNLIHALRLRQIEAAAAVEVGMIRKPDETHLHFAAEAGYVLYTFNRADFYRIHSEWMASGRHHAGLILAQQQRYSVSEQFRRLLRLITKKSAEAMKDQVEFLSTW